jgi:alpha-mannosidase
VRLNYFMLAILGEAAIAVAASAQSTQPSQQETLYCVGYAHLDTQWRWSYPQVIAEFLRKTMEDNFKLFDKYPHYLFNFTGANRYMMMKEYFPEDYAKLKQYIAAGRWFPGGSSMEEGDVDMPDGEGIIRQVLYGNLFFKHEFGKQSSEFMLPDCFGFQASLPSLLAHCGLKGFSTQKLTWGSAVGIPFNVGVWEGPDGNGVVAALNPTPYVSKITTDLSNDPEWIKRLDDDVQRCGVPIDYRYWGTGDRGGAPEENSVKWMEKSVAGNGPVKVIEATSEQMFNELTPDEIAKLPRYKGDLLLTNHSTGSLSSESYIKRMNRKNEQLADAAERACVMADWLGAAPYPLDKLNAAWTLVLGAHFHDTMAGTAVPKSYEYSWNNELIAANQFAAVVQDAASAVIGQMDTRGKGAAIVVYNPLAFDRDDIAEATVTFPGVAPAAIRVTGHEGVVPSQIVSESGNEAHILFRASAPSVGFSVFDVEPAEQAMPARDMRVTDNSLENSRFVVTLNSDGDISSVYDKLNHRQVLSAPARLAFLTENPIQYPAWNMYWEDRKNPPRCYVTGPAQVQIVENGAARVALEVTRYAEGSKFVQTISLDQSGDWVNVATTVDWQTSASSLKAVFPFSFGNPLATYESQTAAVQRGNNNEKKFEVPQQRWLDLTATDGSFGVAVLNDCKFGSDKPDDNTVRLTLLYTPGIKKTYQDQGTQDWGRQVMQYAIAPHAGSWQNVLMPSMGARFNQSLMTFQSPAHDGTLAREFSMLQVDNGAIAVTAFKRAEESNDYIVRVNETTGEDVKGARIEFASLQSATEVNGQEQPIGPATIDNNAIVFDIQHFGLHSFRVKLGPPSSLATAPVSQPLALKFDLDAISDHTNLTAASFDDEGRSYPAEAMPDTLVCEGIKFNLSRPSPLEQSAHTGVTSTAGNPGASNALTCRGQSISIPSGAERVYILAAAVDGDQTGKFTIGKQIEEYRVQDWGGYVGQWDNRVWKGVVPQLTYAWKNRLGGLTPGFVKTDTIAWFCSHRHHPLYGNEYYKFCYLFKYGFDVPSGADSVKLPDNEKIRIFAMTAASGVHDQAVAARPLYDTLTDRGPLEAPAISPPGGTISSSDMIRIDHPLYWKDGDLHYTIDGSEPMVNSPVYLAPFSLDSNTTVRAAEVDDAGHQGPDVTVKFVVSDAGHAATN